MKRRAGALTVALLFGWNFFRALLFPWAFLLLMIPIPAIIFNQITFPLQLLASRVSSAVLPLLGVPVLREGNVIHLPFITLEVAEACSGIRSLIAIIMLTAIYAHVFEKQLWKKVVLLVFSVAFAVIANAGRIFTIILIARMGYPDLAGGIYHEYSGFISFPIALGAMYLFHKLLNLRSTRSAVAASAPATAQ